MCVCFSKVGLVLFFWAGAYCAAAAPSVGGNCLLYRLNGIINNRRGRGPLMHENKHT